MILFALFYPARLGAVAVSKWLPDNRLRRILCDRTLRDRHPWKFALFALGGSIGMPGRRVSVDSLR